MPDSFDDANVIYTDMQLQCSDCGRDFIHTANDQQFYNEKGFVRPRRCRDCRRLMKAHRDSLKVSA